MPQSSDPYDLGIEPLGYSANDPYGLGIEPIGGYTPPPEPKKPQGWVDWGIEQVLRTAPPVIGGIGGGILGAGAGGIGAVPGAALGGASGQVFGQSLGDWWAGTESSPAEYLVGAGAAALPGFTGASRAATPALRMIGNAGRGALEGAVTNVATTPFEEWADTGNWMPSKERVIGSAASGLGFGGVLGGGFSAAVGNPLPMDAPRNTPPPPVEAAPPPPAAANLWDAGMGTRNYGPVTPEPVYGPEVGPYGTGQGQMSLGLDDPFQGSLNLGPYRAPSGRMTNTGPGMPPKMGPPVGELPIQQGAGGENPWLEFYPEQGNLFGQPPPTPAPVPRETPASQGWYESPSGGMVQGTPPAAPAPVRTLPPPPNEPPAGGGGTPIVAPPVAPPVTQAVGQQQPPVQVPEGKTPPIFHNEGRVVTVPDPDPRIINDLKSRGYVVIQGARSPEGYIIMSSGADAPKILTGDMKVPRAPVATKPNVPGGIGRGMVVAGDMHPVPNEKVTEAYITNMAKGGYEKSHSDATTTYFKKIEDVEPTFQRVFGDEGNPAQPGEQRGRVAPFVRQGRQVYEIAEDLNNVLVGGVPDDPRVSTLFDEAEQAITSATDPEIVRDNLNQIQGYSHNARNTPDQNEFFRSLWQVAAAKLREFNSTEGPITVHPQAPPGPPMEVDPHGQMPGPFDPMWTQPSGAQLDPRMSARIEQASPPGVMRDMSRRPPPDQPQLLPMEVGQSNPTQDIPGLRAERLIDRTFGQPLNEPQQQSMIPMFQEYEAKELMRRMGIDTSGRHGRVDEGEGDFPAHARVPLGPGGKNLFRGSKGKGLGKGDFQNQWNQSIREAEHLGIDWKKYDNLDELQWDITRKTAQITAQTGRNPLDEIDEGPAHARVPGKGLTVSANLDRAVVNITRDYTSPLPAVMGREGMQNHMDAAELLGKDGVVKARLNYNDNTLEIYDNGSGMDEDVLANKLFEIFSSGKEGEAGATGGKGIGSAAYIYGGKHFEIDTVAVDSADGKKYRIMAGGTPQQFMDQTQGSDWNKMEVDPSTPTGTTIKISMRSDQSLSFAEEMINNIVRFSRNRNARIVVADTGSGTYNKDVSDIEFGDRDVIEYEVPSTSDDKVIGDFTTHNRESDVKISIPNEPTHTSEYIKVHYLNNGMYQFSNNVFIGGKGDDIPQNLIVDIHPLASDLDELYPFINTREDVKKDIRTEVEEFIASNIGGPAVSRRKNRTQELYDKMQSHGIQIPGSKRNPILFDPGDRLEPHERNFLTKSTAVRGLIQVFDNIQDSILRAVGKQEWIDRLEGVGIFLTPDSYGMHIPNPTTKKSSIGINPFIRIADGESAKDVAWHTTITNLHEAAHIGSEGGDPINLTVQDMNDPRLGEWFQSYMNELTRHQDVGYSNTGHGVAFGHRLGEVYAQFGVARTYQAAAEIQHALTGGSKSGSYSPEIQRALQLYTDSRGRDAVTEDLLSRTGVKSKDRGRVRQEGIPGNNQADGDRVAAEVDASFNRTNDHPAVAKLRGLPKANEGDFNNTYFILPDGSRHSIGSNMTHNLGAQTVGTDLTEALGAGVVRFAGNGVEVGGRITHAQADQLKQSMDFDYGPNNKSVEMWIDVRQPNGEMKARLFDGRASAEAIRNWVNSHYVAEDVPRFSRVKPKGEMPPAPPGRDPNDTSTWRRVKENAGWGQGNTPKPGKKKEAEINYVKEVLALPTGATTTMDFSAPGRNGLSMILTKDFWRAAGQMFGGLSKDGFDAIDKDLRSKPIFQKRIDEEGNIRKSYAEEIGMKLFEPAGTAPIGKRAEGIASRWLETGGSVPYASAAYRHTLGKPVRMSNRAYITFLNSLNANRTEFLLNKARDMSIEGVTTGSMRKGMMPWKTKVSTQEALEADPYTNLKLGREIAEFVNTATGHGPLKTHLWPHRSGEINLEAAAGALSHVMFSQGQLASRVRMLNPSTYMMATPFVRKQYVKAALSSAAAWAAFATLGKAAGAEVGDDPTSADFGKVKIGDTRIDPGAGFLQFMVLYSRMYSGGYTSSATGEFHRFGEGFQAETQMSNLMRFGSNKLNPVWKFAYDVMNQSQYNPTHVYDRTAQLAVPLFVQDIIDVTSKNPELVPWLGPMAFGVGAQTYSKGESVGKLVNPENDWLATGGGLADLAPDYIHPRLDY